MRVIGKNCRINSYRYICMLCVKSKMALRTKPFMKKTKKKVGYFVFHSLFRPDVRSKDTNKNFHSINIKNYD